MVRLADCRKIMFFGIKKPRYPIEYLGKLFDLNREDRNRALQHHAELSARH